MKTLAEIERVDKEIRKMVDILDDFPEIRDPALSMLYDWDEAFGQYLELGSDETIQALEAQRHRFSVLYRELMKVLPDNNNESSHDDSKS